jgi:hypothetical protein
MQASGGSIFAFLLGSQINFTRSRFRKFSKLGKRTKRQALEENIMVGKELTKVRTCEVDLNRDIFRSECSLYLLTERRCNIRIVLEHSATLRSDKLSWISLPKYVKWWFLLHYF